MFDVRDLGINPEEYKVRAEARAKNITKSRKILVWILQILHPGNGLWGTLVYGVSMEVQVFLIIMIRGYAHWAFGIGIKKYQKLKMKF